MPHGHHNELRTKRRPVLLARLALLVGLIYTHFTVTPSVAAAVCRPPRPAGHVRALTPAEMGQITGARQHGLSATPDAGHTYPWEGSHRSGPTNGGAGENSNSGNNSAEGGSETVGGGPTDGNALNTSKGNKLTSLTLVDWMARGGRLPVGFTLFHNSMGNRSSELGPKWTHSYDLYLMIDDVTGNATVHWGDDRSYTFIKNLDGSFSAPTGIHDTLALAKSSVYTLTTKDQIRYDFTTVWHQWHCTSISDRNDNTITINYTPRGLVSSIVDPTGRTITLGYDFGVHPVYSAIGHPLHQQRHRPDGACVDAPL